MQFKKIKFNAKDKTIDVQYTIYDDTASNDISTKFGNIVHQDFIDAIKSLRYHFARLTDLRECCDIDESHESVDKLFEHTALQEISVSSVTFSNSCDTEVVCISGSKQFNGKFINLTSPLTTLDPEGYVYYWELSKCLETLREETRLYIEEQKWGVKQQSLFSAMDDEFAEDDSQSCAIAAEAIVEQISTHSKRGRKSKTDSQIQPS